MLVFDHVRRRRLTAEGAWALCGKDVTIYGDRPHEVGANRGD